MNRKKTTEEFKQEVYNLVKNEYEVLGEYKNTDAKILIRHNKCNHEYMVTPYNFKKGTRCPECSKKIRAQKRKMTTSDFKNKVYDLVNNEYDVLGEYINSSTPIKMKHNNCGYIYYVRPNNFLRGNKCPRCYGTKKRTTEEFKKEVYDVVQDEYEVSGEYINNGTPIEIKHSLCGHIYNVTPNNFLRGSRCPVCSKNKKKNTEEFKKEVHNLFKDEYEVLGEYINNKIPVTIKHNKCGNIYNVSPSSVLKGHGCARCSGNKKKTIKEFKKEVYDLVESEYEVIGEYINSKTPILMKHNTCNSNYLVRPSEFLKGKRCPECYGIKKKTTEEFKEEVYNLVGHEYEVLEEYTNAKTFIRIKHNKCGFNYMVTPNSFLNGSRCPECYGTKKKTTEEFKNAVYNLVQDEYEVLGEYINVRTPIKFKHNRCGHEYYTTSDKFLNSGRRCPKCSSSKGESMIIIFLEKHKINYKHDKSYGDCYYKSTLRFDFLIFDNDNNLKLICEFDGIQHFEPVEIFGGEEGFKETKIRDNIKNKFCKDKEIPLVRIPYWEIDNIHKILGEKLYKLGLIK